MKGLPAELIYILIIGGVLLFNYVMRQAARQRQAESPPEEAPQDAWSQDESPQDAPVADRWAVAPRTPAALPVAAAAVERARRSQSPTASLARPRRRFSRHSLMGTRRDVQNAVVVAAILGPCRAFEPHDKQ
jgi:hypothetical protein